MTSLGNDVDNMAVWRAVIDFVVSPKIKDNTVTTKIGEN